MKNIFLYCTIISLIFSGKVYPQFGAEQILIDHNMPTDPKTLSLICSADIDGNGYVDIIGVNSFDIVYALKNMGDGNYVPELLFEVAFVVNSLSVIDFNNDGAHDFMVRDGSQLTFYVNNSGVFTLSSFTIANIRCATVADFNNDGMDDIAVGFTNEFRTYINTGGDVMELYSTTSVNINGSAFIKLIAAADGNLNGYADVAIMLSTGKIRVFLGAEGGVFLNGGLYFDLPESPGSSSGKNLIWSNLNSDSRPELVAFYSNYPNNNANARLYVFEQSEGGFTTINVPFPDSKPYNTLITGDLAGVGHHQIIAGFHKADVFSSGGLLITQSFSGALLITNSTTENPEFRLILSSAADPKFEFQHLGIADVAGNNLPEVIVSSNKSYFYGYLENNGPGASNEELFNSLKHFFPFETADKIDAIDLDGNGSTELVYLKSSNTTSTIIRAAYDTNGQFQNEVLLELPSYQNRKPKYAMGDVNADGIADIVTGSSNLQGDYVIKLFLRIDQNVTLPADTILIVDYDPYFEKYDIQIIDINGDGFPDLGFTDRFALNDGTGNFGALSAHLTDNPVGRSGFTFTDVDADGNPDVYFTTSTGSTMYFRKNSGNGAFDPIMSSNGAASLTGSPVPFLKDVNSDFLPDRISFGSNTPTGRVRISYNADDFQFNAPVTIPVNMPNALTSFGGMAEFSDLNFDGLTDYVYYIFNTNNEGIYFQYNNGSLFGQQNLAFHHTLSNPNQPFLVRDLTNDGSPDFITWQPAVTSSILLPATRQPGKLIFRPSSAIQNLQISGRIFFDENENGVFDGIDEPIPYEKLVIESLETTAFSTSAGSYDLKPTAFGSYEIGHSVDSELWEITTGADLITVELSEGAETFSNIDFGFIPAVTEDQYQIDLSSGVQRCGESTMYNAFIRNTGTTTEPLKLTVVLDPATTFISSDPEPVSVTANVLEYELDALKFFHFSQISLLVQMPAEESSLSHSMTLKKSDNTTLESQSFSENTSCSGTENTISESVGWLEEKLFLVDTTLVFTIRMQNLASAAEIARLSYLLSYHTDLSSFELLAFTNLPELSIKNGISLEALYSSDFFSGVSDDFHGSEAILKFKVKVYEDTPVGSLVASTGFIKFGNNLPYSLVPVQNKVYSCNGLSDFNTVLTYTDCDAGIFNMSFLSEQPYIDSYEWSLNGEVITSDASGDVEGLFPGEYELNLEVSNELCATDASTYVFTAPGNNTFDLNFDGTHIYTIPGFYQYRWYKNDAVFAVNQSNTVLPVGPGVYKVRVRVTEDGLPCQFWSNEFLYNPLSTEDGIADGILIYPNPVDALLTINTSQSIEKLSGLEMVNSLGQVCFRTSITSESAQIDTKTLTVGLYTLLLTATDGTVFRSKVLVAR